jgi:hypothetical protein
MHIEGELWHNLCNHFDAFHTIVSCIAICAALDAMLEITRFYLYTLCTDSHLPMQFRLPPYDFHYFHKALGDPCKVAICIIMKIQLDPFN